MPRGGIWGRLAFCRASRMRWAGQILIMVPFWGRFSLRTARVALAVMSLAWCAVVRPAVPAWAVAVGYMIFSAVVLLAAKFDIPPRSVIALAGDALFFVLCQAFFPVDGILALSGAYVLISAALLHPLIRFYCASAAVVISSGVGAFIHWRLSGGRLWWTLSTFGAGLAFAFYKRYLERRMSRTLRHNVMIRSRAESAREAERQRIAADFHDGPLQNFISFQMRLEIIRKLLARDTEAAAAELRQLQTLCRDQVTDLRGFVRSMRPVDEGVSLSASLSRMVEQFQRDTGIAATFASTDFGDPQQTEVSLELLQIVRETLANVQRHSGASRVAVHLGKQAGKLEVRAEDNGSGFPFAGSFRLEELDLMRMGPVSIKRRVRLLGGELLLDSHPGQGCVLQIRVPL